MKKWAAILVGAIVISAAAGSVSYGEEGSSTAKGLFEQKCGICHSIDRPKSKKKSPDQWEQTVMRMKHTNGAPVTDTEAGVIIKYLSEHYGM